MAEQGLPDDAIVVRGGLMGTVSLESNAYGSFEECGMWALSVWSYPDMTADEVVEEAHRVDGEALPNGKIRSARAGTLREHGYELVATNQRGHYSLVVPPTPGSAVWEDLREVFDDPMPNPEPK